MENFKIIEKHSELRDVFASAILRHIEMSIDHSDDSWFERAMNECESYKMVYQTLFSLFNAAHD